MKGVTTMGKITSVMQVLMMLPAFIKLIMELMDTVQAEFAQGTGPDKKTAVLAGIQAVIGDATVWQKVSGLFSTVIDFLALFKTKTA
jgi:hypothetical protein